MIRKFKDRTLLDQLLYVYIALALSNLTVALPQLLNVSLTFVGACEVLFLSFYLFQKKNVFLREHHRGFLLAIIFLFLLWPLTSVFWSPIIRLREPVLAILFFMQIAAGIIFVRMYSWRSISRLAGFVLIFVIGTIFASWLYPASFQFMVDREFGGRGFGIYGQPNRTGLAIVILFFIWVSGYTPRFYFLKPLAFVAIILPLVLTGSRGSLLIALICFGIYFLIDIRRGQTVESFIGQKVLSVFVVVGILAFSWLFAFSSGLLTADRIQNSAFFGLFERSLSMFSDRAVTFEEDASVQGRLYIAQVYFSAVLERPFHGHGLFSVQYGRFVGQLPMAAHNTFLHNAYEFGLFHVIGMIALYFYCGLLFYRMPRTRSANLRPIGLGICFTAFILFHFHTNTIFDSRYSVLLFGIMLGVLLNDRYIGFHENNEPRPGPLPMARNFQRLR